MMKRKGIAFLLSLSLFSSPTFANKGEQDKKNPGFFAYAMGLVALAAVSAQLVATVDAAIIPNSGKCRLTQIGGHDFGSTCAFESSEELAFAKPACSKPNCGFDEARIFIDFKWDERKDCCKFWSQYGDPHGPIEGKVPGEPGPDKSIITCNGRRPNECKPSKAGCDTQAPFGVKCKWTGKMKKGPCEASAPTPIMTIWGAADSTGEVQLQVREVVGIRSNIDRVLVDSIEEGETADLSIKKCNKMQYNGTALEIRSKREGKAWKWNIKDKATGSTMAMSCMDYGIDIDMVTTRGETSGFMATGKFGNEFDSLVFDTPACAVRRPGRKFVPPFLPSKLVAFADLPDDLADSEPGFLIQYEDKDGVRHTVKGVPLNWGINPSKGASSDEFPELFGNRIVVVPHIPGQELSTCASFPGAKVSIVYDAGSGVCEDEL